MEIEVNSPLCSSLALSPPLFLVLILRSFTLADGNRPLVALFIPADAKIINTDIFPQLSWSSIGDNIPVPRHFSKAQRPSNSRQAEYGAKNEGGKVLSFFYIF